MLHIILHLERNVVVQIQGCSAVAAVTLVRVRLAALVAGQRVIRSRS
jgi:hypothetical protein